MKFFEPIFNHFPQYLGDYPRQKYTIKVRLCIMSCWFLLVITFLQLVQIRGSSLKSGPRSCLEANFVITDDNLEEALAFYKTCKDFGLTDSDLPKNYMRRLSNKLKRANEVFLRETSMPIRKVCKVEKNVNELYHDLVALSKSLSKLQNKDNYETTDNCESILEESGCDKKTVTKKGNCGCKQHKSCTCKKKRKMRTSECPHHHRSTACLHHQGNSDDHTVCPHHCDGHGGHHISSSMGALKNKIKVFADSEVSLYCVLLFLCILIFFICLLTCCYVIRIYSRLYLFTTYDDEARSISSSTNYRGAHGSTNRGEK